MYLPLEQPGWLKLMPNLEPALHAKWKCPMHFTNQHSVLSNWREQLLFQGVDQHSLLAGITAIQAGFGCPLLLRLLLAAAVYSCF